MQWGGAGLDWQGGAGWTQRNWARQGEAGQAGPAAGPGQGINEVLPGDSDECRRCTMADHVLRKN